MLKIPAVANLRPSLEISSAFIGFYGSSYLCKIFYDVVCQYKVVPSAYDAIKVFYNPIYPGHHLTAEHADLNY